MKKELLEIRGGFFNIADAWILRNIHFYICECETVCICGLHGAGKTTIANILTGKQKMTEGKIFWKENSVADNIAFLKKKVHHIYQFQTIGGFSVCDYMFAMRAVSFQRILYNRKSAMIQTQNLLNSVGIYILPSTMMGELTDWQKFQLEILKNAEYGVELMIVDELATAFDESLLMEFQRKIQEKYEIAFLYLNSSAEHRTYSANRTYLMKNQTLFYMSEKEAGNRIFFQNILPNQGNFQMYEKRKILFDRDLLEIEVTSPIGEKIPVAVHSGEIAGILDLDGKVIDEFVKDLRNGKNQRNYLNGKYMSDYRTLTKAGVGIVFETEQRRGLFPELNLEDNILISTYRIFGKMGLVNENISRYLWETIAQPMIQRKEVGRLSLLEKIKVLLLRRLVLNPKFLILENLTLYLDYIEREETLKIIKELATQGIGILLVSSNLTEVYSICDRILIMQGSGRYRLFEHDEE